MTDAVVIGAGHNGLVAANVLADAGWEVVVLEAAAHPGGAVRTEELTMPGFRHDVFSAFYPLAAASPVIQSLELEQHGLRWMRASHALAHPVPDGRCALISGDIDETAASLDSFAPGDGEAWRRMFEEWTRISEPFIECLLTPFPPVRSGVRLASRLGLEDGLRFARQAILSVRRMGEEEFAGAGGRLLLAGNALHTDLPPDGAGSALFGWLLSCLAQQVGFPVPEGGAGGLIDALIRRLEQRGGSVHCNTRVDQVVVRGGRAVGVVTSSGDAVSARRAVLADVDAPSLFLDLVGPEHLAPRVLEDLGRFEFDAATVKVDWALAGPVPWTAPQVARAGTVHIADSLDHLTWYQAHLASGKVPADPFLLVGQMAVADPSRAPAGRETLWAYTHVPRRIDGDAGTTPRPITGRWDDSDREAMADRIEEGIERYAPGFRDLVLERHVLSPVDLEAANSNLVGGAINAGTSQLHQQLVFRPTPGLGRPETPIRGLFLASASAHPGGGVHGAPGNNAARAALGHESTRRGGKVAAAAALGALGLAAWRAGVARGSRASG